jgi:hypothetical protein
MSAFASIFDEFNLPNATTWFYFSLLVAIALFFKFTRLLSVRNWDVLTLFLLVPGLLLLQEAQTASPTPTENVSLRAASVVAGAGQALAMPGFGVSTAIQLAGNAGPTFVRSSNLLWYGYLWLVAGSVVFLVRCLVDLVLIRRPALSPNLNLSGLAWLGAALFVCLVAVAVRKPASPSGPVGKRSAALDETQRRAEDLVKQEIASAHLASINTEFWVECISAILCHLALVVGLVVIGWKHFQDPHAGVAAATFYLLLPYTAYHVGQVHHILPTALLIWAVAAYRRPTVAGLLLGLACGTGYFPVLLSPLWLGFYWKRGEGRFLGAFVLAAGICLAAIAGILWMDGELARSIHSTLSMSDWQPWKQPNPATTKGFWTGVPWAWAYRMPVFIAYLAFVAATPFWPSPKNLAHLLALSAAVIIGIQLWFADQGGVYVLWYAPLLLLLVFRPNLADRQALAIAPETDWLRRVRRSASRAAAMLLHLPEPAVRTH